MEIHSVLGINDFLYLESLRPFTLAIELGTVMLQKKIPYISPDSLRAIYQSFQKSRDCDIMPIIGH